MAGEPSLVSFSVGLDVLLVPLSELLNGVHDGLVTLRLSHRLRAVIRVASRPIPVTLQTSSTR